ncbi:MAG TPA: 6-phosphogluconolactonase, partial [Verrucomicrobiae bacterium]|nr:6-phosphogluconolactonase [Verrucomicrobiae bacterium]
ANRVTSSHDVALSGGRITGKFLAAVVEQSKQRKISLGQVNFFWADERCVPPTDAQSNFKLVNDGLLAPLNISPEKIHRLRGEDGPEAGAKQAEAETRKIVGANAHGQPVLDLIFLGLGEDGHVASLAPEESESMMQDQSVFRGVHNFAKPPPERITIGYQTIAAARQVWMLASGAGKEQAMRDSLAGNTPFGRVLKLRNGTRIFSDIAA